MDCTELKALLERVKGEAIPRDLRPVFESHLEACRTCRAAMNNFLKIGKILEKTVYSEAVPDHYLNFLRHSSGRKLRWGTQLEEREPKTKVPWLLILRVAAGFAVAIGLGASAAVILGHFGLIGRFSSGHQPAEGTPSTELAAPAPDQSTSQTGNQADMPQYAPPDSAVNPAALYHLLNSDSARAAAAIPAREAPADSARLKSMEAELGALRDALSRTPDDHSLRQRTMDKHRQVIEERKTLGAAARVKDYYNLGYLHYEAGEYPQTAIVTGEGLRMVRIGPTEYLHYLKGMSHYQIALKALNPLPADTTRDEAARIKGATLRAQLDLEGRERAVMELRRAVSEFSYLLNIPSLKSSGQDWILKCENLIRKSAEQG
ncbi:MAG: hypothetical protein A3F83_06770 [Candidatus Glassbacteria bacterium RIFCSPLOWO2_12_FULL_58_11]|uniref:Zinc-finger domain-containing protein n=1 Tax=Candidatus Glassbacteria bacterium RIFCSPLOWO2_12_FULL_58_11 TaxID=1817867 RepID=A0A1F5Z3I9_9BACT|nr:MAG: hypothetical protein A3F83_06770 [Candidatus Glassbacteria bacterium RIFCSPLOWO2_12_FULL_58_11]